LTLGIDHFIRPRCVVAYLPPVPVSDAWSLERSPEKKSVFQQKMARVSRRRRATFPVSGTLPEKLDDGLGVGRGAPGVPMARPAGAQRRPQLGDYDSELSCADGCVDIAATV
jgi:hypothetical protein